MLDKLAVELHYNIFFHCKNKDLAALSLVSRSPRFPAQSLLYTSIEISLSDLLGEFKPKARERMLGIQTQDHLRSAIRRIRLNGKYLLEGEEAGRLTAQLLQQLPRIRSLELEHLCLPISSHTVIHSLRHLKHLTMFNCTFNADRSLPPQEQLTTVSLGLDSESFSLGMFDNPEEIQAVMDLLSSIKEAVLGFLQPSLVHLNLHLNYVSELPDDQREQEAKSLWDSIPPLPRLKTLTIEGECPLNLEHIQDLFSRIPSIEQLRITSIEEFHDITMGHLRPNLLPNLKFYSGPPAVIPALFRTTPLAHVEVREIPSNLEDIWTEGKDQLVSAELVYDQSHYDSPMFKNLDRCHKLVAISICGFPFLEFGDVIWQTLRLPPNVESVTIELYHDGSVEDMEFLKKEIKFMRKAKWNKQFSHLRNLAHISFSVMGDRDEILYEWEFYRKGQETHWGEDTIEDWRDEMIGPSSEPDVWESYRYKVR